MDTVKVYRENARRELLKNAASYIERVLEAKSHERTTVQRPNTHL